MTTGDENKPERMERRGILAYIYAEAEYILTIPDRYKHMVPSSWGPYVLPKSKYAPDRLSIGNVWAYVIISFLGCLTAAGFISIAFWLPIARSTLFAAEYYVGIAISLLLAAAYMAFRKPLRRWFLRHSPSEGTGERRFINTELVIFSAMAVLLFVLQGLVWDLPFGMSCFYFLFFNSMYSFIVMLIYLRMRLQAG